MSILAPNTTHIPNIIFDHWMAVLSPGEFKVLLCICRKTFGWHKSRDSISSKQICKMTGLSRKGIEKMVEDLIRHGLVIKIKSKTTDGDDAPNQFEINVHLDHSEGGGRELSTVQVGYSVPEGVRYSVPSQKKDSTKETNTKENSLVPNESGTSSLPSLKSEKRTSGEATDLAKALLDHIKKIHPKFKEPKEGKWEEDLDKMHKIDKREWEEIRKLIDYVFTKDAFWVKTIQSADGLRRNFDKIWVKMAPVSNQGTKVEKNAEIASKMKRALAQSGDQGLLVLYKSCVTNAKTGDSISYDIDSETFEEILLRWTGLTRK